jgi:hypothetical protein
MARIRTVKPEFWSDEKLSPLADSVRLLFLGLISMADDYGRLLDSPKQIEAFVWPHEDRSRDCREGLAKLSQMSRIVRGVTASGQAVIQIVTWAKHQRVDKPSNRTALPEITTPQPVETSRESVAEESRETRETVATDSRYEVDLGSGSGSGSRTVEVDVEVDAREAREAASSSAVERPGRQQLLDALQPSQRKAMADTLAVYAQGYQLPAGIGIPTPAQIDQACLECLASIPAHDIRPNRVRNFLVGVMRPNERSPETRSAGSVANNVLDRLKAMSEGKA